MPDAERWDALPKRLPDWFHDAPLGIFIHWGAYAVPAWAELGAELGAADDGADRLTRNPYAEWYANTIRIEGSPAAEHHRTVHGDAPYDDFLDQWRPDAFDPAAWAELFRRAGADYLVLTTKHHDGITLWTPPAPGSATPCGAGRTVTSSARSPAPPVRPGCASACTTQAGWTGTSGPRHRSWTGWTSPAPNAPGTTSTAGTEARTCGTSSTATDRTWSGTTSAGPRITWPSARAGWASCSSTSTASDPPV